MKKVTIFIFCLAVLALGCSEELKEESTTQPDSLTVTGDLPEEPCPDEWSLYGPTDAPGPVDSKQINDSTTQMLLFGKIWFEIINPVAIGDGKSRCYLKTYRADGMLESEGYGEYYEHPVKDYTMVGNWKFYDCDGELEEEAEYKNGERITP